MYYGKNIAVLETHFKGLNQNGLVDGLSAMPF